jgi:hypothetical protein
MPIMYVEEPAQKPARLKVVLQFLLTVAVLTFCTLMLLR